MASLGISLLEAAALRLLAALGVGVAGGELAKEVAKKRIEEAEKSKDTPIARSETQTEKKEKCKECPPDEGESLRRSFSARTPWIDYQARVTGMPSGPNHIMEWGYAGREFDGFNSANCLLTEAKAGYDQFFTEFGEYKQPFAENIFLKMEDQAMKQNAVAQPKPPVSLRWYFMEPMSYRHMRNSLVLVAPGIEVLYQP